MELGADWTVHDGTRTATGPDRPEPVGIKDVPFNPLPLQTLPDPYCPCLGVGNVDLTGKREEREKVRGRERTSGRIRGGGGLEV